MICRYRGAFEYDWRVRFPGVRRGIKAIGTSEIGWAEAVRLAKILRADPSSALAAAIEGWEYPVTRAELIAMDQWDLAYAATGAKNRKPYKRPFKVAGEASQRGKAMPRSEAIKRLRRDFGHEIPV